MMPMGPLDSVTVSPVNERLPDDEVIVVVTLAAELPAASSVTKP